MSISGPGDPSGAARRPARGGEHDGRPKPRPGGELADQAKSMAGVVAYRLITSMVACAVSS